MITPIEDKISKFVKVKHSASGHDFLLHESLVEKLGTSEKVQVYEMPTQHIAPNSTYPKGKYIARAKFFLASFLEIA